MPRYVSSLRSYATLLGVLIGVAIVLSAAPSFAQKGASCHAGMSFDRFLADLKQQAVAAGVSTTNSRGGAVTRAAT